MPDKLEIRKPISESAPKKKSKEEMIFEQLADDKRLRGILSRFARGQLRERKDVGPEDVVTFLNKYPDPHVFQREAKINEFLAEIGALNGIEKRRQYENALNRFQDIVYHQRR